MDVTVPAASNGTNGSVAQKQQHGDMRDYAGPNLFQPHRAQEAIRDAHEKKILPLVGYYAALPSVAVTRWLSPLGYDFVWIDWEHCAMNIETMTTMVHETAFMSGGRTIPFVRVPGHEESTIAFALDAGASIVAPHVDTVEQAKQVVGAIKFGRKRRVPGLRSAPPYRYLSTLTDRPHDPSKGLWESLNGQAALMIQIESLQGIDNLDAILTEVGDDIDVVWLGRLDARISMGLNIAITDPPTEPEWLGHEEKFFEVVRKHNKPYAGFTYAKGDAMLKQSKDMSMCITHADTQKLWEMMGELKDIRDTFAQREIERR